MEGWDHQISADPLEMKQLVGSAKRVTLALGSKKRRVYDDELEMRKAFRRSLFAARDIQEGEVFSEDMIVMKRPGNGVNPNRINEFIGRVARQNIKKDKMLSGDDLSGGLGFVAIFRRAGSKGLHRKTRKYFVASLLYSTQ